MSCMSLYKEPPVDVYVLLQLALVLTTNSTVLTEGPVSVIALVGENALFHCNSSDIFVRWVVDGLQANDPSIVERGISSVLIPSSSSGTFQSILTVPATSENYTGTTVQCIVAPLSEIGNATLSDNATLTILSDVGKVANVWFNQTFILWDPPPTAGVLSGLFYGVMLKINGTDELIVDKNTTYTNCTLPVLQPCQYYTADVTVLYKNHFGDRVIFEEKIPGEFYQFKNVSQEVVYKDFTPTEVFLKLNLTLSGHIPCPDQRLTAQTYPQSNTSDITNHPELVIMSSGDIVYSITTGIEMKQHYTATISLVDNEWIIQELDLTFSTFAVQDCDVSSDQNTSSILVECTFAINSTAPGIVVIQDDKNKTLQRLLQDSDKGSVYITGLPAGEYSVRVYDNMEDYNNSQPAYQHNVSLHNMGTGSSSPMPTGTMPNATATMPTVPLIPVIVVPIVAASFILFIIIMVCRPVIVGIVIWIKNIYKGPGSKLARTEEPTSPHSNGIKMAEYRGNTADKASSDNSDSAGTRLSGKDGDGRLNTIANGLPGVT